MVLCDQHLCLAFILSMIWASLVIMLDCLGYCRSKTKFYPKDVAERPDQKIVKMVSQEDSDDEPLSSVVRLVSSIQYDF